MRMLNSSPARRLVCAVSDVDPGDVDGAGGEALANAEHAGAAGRRRDPHRLCPMRRAAELGGVLDGSLAVSMRLTKPSTAPRDAGTADGAGGTAAT